MKLMKYLAKHFPFVLLNFPSVIVKFHSNETTGRIFTVRSTFSLLMTVFGCLSGPIAEP